MREICAALSFLLVFLVLQGLDREVTIVPPTTHETTLTPDLIDRHHRKTRP